MNSKEPASGLKDEDVKAIRKTSVVMTEDQIKASYAKFIKDHPTGSMTEKELKEMLKKVLDKKDAKLMDEHLFRMYDQNNDGVIDFKEFMTAVIIMEEGTPEQNLERIFRVFDVNGDGVIKIDEMKKIVTSMCRLLKRDNPKLSAEKIIAATAFAETDTNKDGVITLEEFTKACLAKEEFTLLLTMKIVDIFTTNA